jgi:hypothetical protein
MGQQQLLLLVLGIVIVGLAVIVGVQAFSENQKKANVDALTLTSMRIASEAQAWLRTPISFGGGMPTTGTRPSDFNGLTLTIRDLGYPVDNTNTYTDLHGTYSGTVTSGDFVITGSSASTSGGGDNNVVCVYVAGSLVSDISTVVNPSSGNC